MKPATERLLSECLKLGIRRIAICISDPTVPESTTFVFGASYSVFAKGKINDWPAIWKAVENAGIRRGCGNTDQMQISNPDELDHGCYFYRRGEWKKRRAAKRRGER